VRWSLRYKIFAIMGSLVLGLLLATLLLVGLQAGNSARQRIFVDLQGTRMQFEEFQRIRYQSLLALSRILSRTFALRNAVATYHPETVLSAVMSFQARVRSDLFIVTDDEGKLLASALGSAKPKDDFSAYPAIADALDQKESQYIWYLENKLYQVATVPFKAGAELLGTLSVGYELNQSMLHDVKHITGSEITVLAGNSVLASTWDQATRQEISNYIIGANWTISDPEAHRDDLHVREIALGGETYLSLAVPLTGARSKAIGIYILQQSLDQATAFLRLIQRALLVTGLLAVVVALVVSFILARSITRPVEKLVEGAEAVGRGEYRRRIELRSRDELGVLANAYNDMTAKLDANISALNQANLDLSEQAQVLQASLRKIELLEQMKSHLDKFVPDSLNRLIETSPGAPDLDKRDRDVTVLFLDIAGYTRMSEQTSREKMNALVEHYFSSFLDDIY
jgi:sigma-B regulation protein RsbU (phosphoserine phosphatase)